MESLDLPENGQGAPLSDRGDKDGERRRRRCLRKHVCYDGILRQGPWSRLYCFPPGSVRRYRSEVVMRTASPLTTARNESTSKSSGVTTRPNDPAHLIAPISAPPPAQPFSGWRCGRAFYDTSFEGSLAWPPRRTNSLSPKVEMHKPVTNYKCWCLPSNLVSFSSPAC